MNQLSLDIDNVTDNDTSRLLTQVLQVVTDIRANQLALDDRLWKVYDIAVYLQTSERNARYIVNQRGAPRAVQVPTHGEATMKPRYYPDEVKEFIRREGRINPSPRKR